MICDRYHDKQHKYAPYFRGGQSSINLMLFVKTEAVVIASSGVWKKGGTTTTTSVKTQKSTSSFTPCERVFGADREIVHSFLPITEKKFGFEFGKNLVLVYRKFSQIKF